MSLDLADVRIRGRSGDEVRADCPFCDDRKGHLYINARKNLWHCVHCGAGGKIRDKSLSSSRRCTMPLYSSKPQEPPYPSPQELHDVYTVLVNVLGLSKTHRQHLYSPKRGMSPLQVATAQYRTLPPGWETREYVGERVAEHVNPGGIPGFYRSPNGKWTLAGRPGLLIPVRNREGLIQGFQIRPDYGNQKYMWLSSGHTKRHPEGRKVKAAFHVAGPKTDKVWVTEGPLKADISAHLLQETVVAVPGVTMWKACGLVSEMIRQGVREVVMAYDADAATNPNVARAARQLSNALSSCNLQVVYAYWQGYKGLDDLLLAGFEPELKKAL